MGCVVSLTCLYALYRVSSLWFSGTIFALDIMLLRYYIATCSWNSFILLLNNIPLGEYHKFLKSVLSKCI